MVSSLLAIPEVAENQTNKYITINAALAALESAANAVHVDTSAGTGITLSESEFLRNGVFQVSGASANFTLTTQGENSGAVATNRVFVVHNLDTTYTCTIQSDDTGATVDVEPETAALVYQIGDDVPTRVRQLLN